MSNYELNNEDGLEINETHYDSGHVFELTDEQAISEPFAALIESGELVLVGDADQTVGKEEAPADATANAGGADGSTAGSEDAEETQEEVQE